jgi:hypothetical protein
LVNPGKFKNGIRFRLAGTRGEKQDQYSKERENGLVPETFVSHIEIIQAFHDFGY